MSFNSLQKLATLKYVTQTCFSCNVVNELKMQVHSACIKRVQMVFMELENVDRSF